MGTGNFSSFGSGDSIKCIAAKMHKYCTGVLKLNLYAIMPLEGGIGATCMFLPTYHRIKSNMDTLQQCGLAMSNT